MDLRTPLARVIGLGSANEGVSHWWWQRLTAAALLPLTVWFIVSLLGLLGRDHSVAVQWLDSSLNASLLILFIASLFHHMQLGLQVVIEDYVSNEGWRMGILVTMKFVTVFLAFLAIVSVLRVSLG